MILPALHPALPRTNLAQICNLDQRTRPAEHLSKQPAIKGTITGSDNKAAIAGTVSRPNLSVWSLLLPLSAR